MKTHPHYLYMVTKEKSVYIFQHIKYKSLRNDNRNSTKRENYHQAPLSFSFHSRVELCSEVSEHNIPTDTVPPKSIFMF